VLGAPPDGQANERLGQVIGRLRRSGTIVSWALPFYEPSLTPPWTSRTGNEDEDDTRPPDMIALDATAPRVADAVRYRAVVAQRKAEAQLSKLGVRVGHVRPGKRALGEEQESAPERAAR
jgi:hypothetical protein